MDDEVAWQYGDDVSHLVNDEEFKHLKSLRLWELLDERQKEQHYRIHPSDLRRDFLSAFEESDSIEAGLEGFLKQRSNVFNTALTAKRNDFIHLSSFGSSFETDAFSIPLLPQSPTEKPLPPWESAIAIELNGSYRTLPVNTLSTNPSYELIHIDNLPSHYRAKSPLFTWTPSVTVSFTHLYPTGLLIRPSPQTSPCISTLPMPKIRLLSQTFSPIILRGFSNTTSEPHFLTSAHSLGQVLTWTFGQILKVKDSRSHSSDANNVTSNEAMPMHFDGIFKFTALTDPATGEERKVLTPPAYQYFTCISTAPRGDGYTLFAASRLFFKFLPQPWTVERLEGRTWTMANDGFWSARQEGLRLVVGHAETGERCLRWHEPWTRTKFSKYVVEIDEVDGKTGREGGLDGVDGVEEDGKKLVKVINQLIYDYRVCLRFEWEKGDLLVNDNVAMLHTRTAFTGECEREMWRIHFD